jgi:hypothetical protein
VRRLARGDATVVGVGQGRQSAEWAFPRQMYIAKTVKDSGQPHRVMRAVDSDGERSVVIVPALRLARDALRFGREMGQRSVLQGKKEYLTVSGNYGMQFGKANVFLKKPYGFWTFLPEQGLYYQLVPVKPHLRNGRPVVGYATRRRIRRRR